MRATVICGLGAALMLGACGGGGGGGDEEAATAEASGTAASASAPAAGAAGAGDTLRVRPGLWRTVRREAGGEAETDEQCITADDATVDASDFAEMPQGCTQSTSRQGGAFVIRTSCPTGQGMPPTETEVRINAQGETRYTGSVTIAMTIPGQGRQAMTVQMEGAYIGPCPAGAAEE
jgi:hypothetical protein